MKSAVSLAVVAKVDLAVVEVDDYMDGEGRVKQEARTDELARKRGHLNPVSLKVVSRFAA